MSSSFSAARVEARSWVALSSAVGWALALIGLNCLLFLPSYSFSQPHASFWPVLSAHDARARGLRGAYLALLSLTLRRENHDLFRISVDYFALLAIAVLAAHTRFARVARRGAVGVYVALLVFLGYDRALAFFFLRAPALGEDYRLALNLMHFVGAIASVGLFALILAGALALWLAGWLFARVLLVLQTHARRAWLAPSLAFAACCGASLAWYGVERDDPIVQLVSKRVLYNIRASVAASERMAPLRTGAVDRSYDALTHVALARKPNCYLFMIEAYGEILATWDMAPAYRALLARVQQRLEAAGYHARSAYSAAPVHGGMSWLSIATVHTGIMIDQPLAYAQLELVGARVPSLTRFFDAAGYRTYALQPGSADRTGLHRVDLFNYDVVLDADTLGYHGPRYGWGHIPDQYSLSLLRERVLPGAPSPRFVFYMGVSTHYPWGDDRAYYVQDWRALNGPRPPPAADPRWPELPEKAQIGSALRRGYFDTIEYEWRVLCELLEAEPSRDIVVLVLGDHQPRLEANAPGEPSMNTPVHVLSRDAAFVERFAAQGFQPGLYADPTAHAPLAHEGLFSLWVSKLAAAYGADASHPVPYYPAGIGVAGLNR